jgi:competence protein ComEC
LLLVVVVLHPFSSPRPDGRLHVNFLDVDQGDSALVTFPDGTTMLIDGGGRMEFQDKDDSDESYRPDTPGIGEAIVSPYLWHEGYSSIDYMVATHADADHIQGLTEVAENFDIGLALVGRQPADDPEYIQFSDALARRSIPVEMVSRGRTMKIGGGAVEFLYPLPDTSENTVSDNNSSVVIRIVCGGRVFLFAGDIESAAEGGLLSGGGTLAADVVKVPHHGSRTSSTRAFVDATRAALAVVSAGRHSRFGHPHREVAGRWASAGARVLITAQNGMISVSTDGRDLIVDTFSKNGAE